MNHVFISYRFESVEHARDVRRLGEQLRLAGISVELDQFYLERNPGGPDEGWPKWCEDHASRSAAVLIVASPGWYAAYNKTGPRSSGLGAADEADLFRQAIWDEKGFNNRIRFVHLSDIAAETIPTHLRAWHKFHPFAAEADLRQLVNWLADRLGLGSVEVAPSAMNWPRTLHNFQPDIANRQNEWSAIKDVFMGISPHRLLLIEGEAGYGKSELLHQAAAYAEQLGVPICRLDFQANYNDPSDLLGRLALDFGDHLPGFTRENGYKSHLLVEDVRALRRPVVLMFDTYEKAVGSLQDWVSQNLLAEIAKAPALLVIIAGRACVPDPSDVRWRHVSRCVRLGPIYEAAEWNKWIQRRYPIFQQNNIDLRTLVLASRGVPKTFADLCRIVSNQARMFNH